MASLKEVTGVQILAIKEDIPSKLLSVGMLPRRGFYVEEVKLQKKGLIFGLISSIKIVLQTM